MQKQRNAVEKSLLELSEQIKTQLTQRVYAALSEAGVTDRHKSIRILSIINAAVDECYSRYSRTFDKAVNDLVATAREEVAPKKNGKK